MAIDDLVARLEAETDQKVEAARARARGELDRIGREGARPREDRRAAAIDALRQRVEREQAPARAAARAEGRATVLAARHRLLDRVHAAAVAGLRADERWVERVRAEAARFLPDGPVVVDEEIGGLVVRAGACSVDGRLTTRLDALRPRLARETLDRLEAP